MALGSAKKKVLTTRHLLALFLLLVIVFLSLALLRVFFKDYAVRKEIARLQERVRVLEEKKLHSLALLDYIATDTYVEEQARTKLGMVKDGEQAVIFSADATAPTSFEERLPGLRLTNRQVWWYYFFAPEKLR